MTVTRIQLFYKYINDKIKDCENEKQDIKNNIDSLVIEIGEDNIKKDFNFINNQITEYETTLRHLKQFYKYI